MQNLKPKKVNNYIRDNKLFVKGYLDLAEGMILAFIFFGGLALSLPSSTLIPHADIILSAATFLFGVASGYYIANRHDRYTQIRSYTAQESTQLINMYEMARLIDTKFAADVAHKIENYMSATYLYHLSNYVIGSQEEYTSLTDEVLKIKEHLTSQEIQAEKFADTIINLNYIREQIYVIGQDRLGWFDWGSLSILSLLIITSLFNIGFENFVVRIIAVVLSVNLVLIILIIRDLDNLRRNEKLMMYGTYDRVFDRIKKPRVYLKSDIQNGMVSPERGHDYRVIHM